jgi:hypothetical protein
MAYRAAAAAIALVAACGPGTSDPGLPTQQLAVQVSGHGTVQLSTGQQCKDKCAVTIRVGTSITASASPDDGWTFSGWSGSCGGGTSCQFTVDKDMELDAAFALKPTVPNQHVLTAARNGSGSIKSSPAGLDCGASCSAQFPDGATVTLSATADSGWRFDSWSGVCGGSGTCIVQVGSDTTVWATFVKLPPPQHVLAITLAGNGSGRVSSTPAGIDCGTTCSWPFAEGTTVQLSAQPASGSTFAAWSGSCSGTAACSIKITADATVTATFNPPPPPPPPPDECAGLSPGAPGAPHSYRQQPLASLDVELCNRGTVDGSGNLALWSTEQLQPFKSEIVFLDFSGHVRGKATGVATELTGQLAGFSGMDVYPQQSNAFDAIVYATDGTNTARASGGGNNPILAEDPTGGMVVALDVGPPAIDAYDATGRRRWRKQVTSETTALGVDRSGNILRLFKSGTLHGQWLDRSGNAGAAFDLGDSLAPPPGDSFELYPRTGSGLFVLRLAGGHTTWLHQIDSLATAAAPAPDYLQARPDTRLHVAHDGQAYAMLPIPAQGQCTQHIEVLAPSGKSCGSAEFALASGSCTTNFIDVGYDGTVVQQLPDSMEDHSCAAANCSCTWRWWPGFFH